LSDVFAAKGLSTIEDAFGAVNHVDEALPLLSVASTTTSSSAEIGVCAICCA
jgi:hypothetical protein